MRRNGICLVLVVWLLLTAACQVEPEPVGGPCTYIDIPGVATVVAIRESDPSGNNCQDAVEVLFDFRPDQVTDQDAYRYPNWSDEGRRLTVGGGMNPNRGWVEAKGIRVGDSLRAVRSEITSGTCTPVLFSFPDLDLSDWSDSCFRE